MTARGTRAHRNVALVSGLAVVLGLMLAHLPGMWDGLAYLGPCLFVYLLLRLGRYPGEKAILAFTDRPPARRTEPSRRGCRPPRVSVPRGGALLAAALAGRAPPWPQRLHARPTACPRAPGTAACSLSPT
jgi:hypothetical protein